MAILKRCGDKLFGAGVATVWLGATAPSASAITEIAAPGASLATMLGGAVIANITGKQDNNSFANLQAEAAKAAHKALKKASKNKLTSFDQDDDALGALTPALSDLAAIIDTVWPQLPELASVKTSENALMDLIWGGLKSKDHGILNQNLQNLQPGHEAMQVIDGVFRSQVQVLLANRELRDQINDVKIDNIRTELGTLRTENKAAHEKTQAEIGSLAAQIEAMNATLAALSGETLSMQSIAEQTDIAPPEVLGLLQMILQKDDVSSGDLLRLVKQSEQEVERLRGEVETLKSLANAIDGIDDALSRAGKALEKGSIVDLEAAQDALATVMSAIDKRDRQSAQNKMRVAKVQADTSLARLDVPAAVRHFEVMAQAARDAEADSSQQPFTWANARHDAGFTLSNHGRVYPGLDAFRASVTAYDDALTVPTKDAMPADWAATQNNKALALQNLGGRASGQDALTYLQQAVAAYDAALTVYTQDTMPADWANTQNNRAIALRRLGERASGQDALTYLQQAITAYDDALTVRTKDAMPADWAMTQNNKAIALRNLGARASGQDALDYLNRAVAAYDASLTVHTKNAQPADWAMTQNNKAVALQSLGERASGQDALTYLQQAVTAYDDALTVRTKDAMPAQWATTQNNKAVAQKYLGERASGQDALSYLQQAVTACDDALTVRTKDAMPADWAMTQNNKANALQTLGERASGQGALSYLKQSITAYDDALTVYTQDAMPADWAMTQNNKANALRNLGERASGQDALDYLNRAVDAYDSALTIHTKDAMPYQFEISRKYRAEAQAMLDALDAEGEG